jgi:methyl-accepting chemotaxis protein
MRAVRNLRLGVRLGIAFGALGLALTIVGVVSLNALGSLDAGTKTITERDSVALAQLNGIGRRVEANGHWTVRHLYVFDGDLAAQDTVAEEIAKNKAAITKNVERLEPQIASGEAKAALTDFTSARKAYVKSFERALELSRQETIDGVEERDGSRTQYEEKVVPALLAFREQLERLETAVGHQATAQAADAASTASSGERTILAVGIAALLAAFALALLITRSVTRPVALLVERLRSVNEHCLTSLRNGLTALAGGDLTVEAQTVTESIENPSRDEIGVASQTLNEMLDKARDSISEFNHSRASLAELIGEVSGSASSVSSASQQMASTSEEAGRAVGEIASAVSDVAQGAERQVRMVESVKGAVQDSAQAATSSAESAQEAVRVAEATRVVAREGVGAAAQATEAMHAVRDSAQAVSGAIGDLSGKSEQIGAIVQTITGIAGQTNLLALNAAIEAARAGEQGRGFAVVAEEVRHLAEESQQAAANIASLIEEIQSETQRAVSVVEDGVHRTEEGAATVEQTREAFERIERSVEEMTERVTQIATAVEQIAADAGRVESDIGEVAAVAEESSASSEQVSASTEETSASTQQVSASAQELASTAQALEELVQRFKVHADELAAEAEELGDGDEAADAEAVTA